MTPATVDVSYFQTFGFLVLRRFFDSTTLAAEIDRVLQDGLGASAEMSSYMHIQFQYVPMMTAATPASLSLIDQTEVVATTLLGGSVLPTRAKAVRYFGNTPWHVDSTSLVESIGFAAYLEPVRKETGALRVLPGSHRGKLGDAIRAMGAIGRAATDLPSHVIETDPGDVIVFDEHLFHSSFGGAIRRQWRTDFLADPLDAEAEGHTKAYFENIYPPEWDGGYDVDRYPSYGPAWLESRRPAVARLGNLGVYELAAAQERFTRSQRDR